MSIKHSGTTRKNTTADLFDLGKSIIINVIKTTNIQHFNTYLNTSFYLKRIAIRIVSSSASVLTLLFLFIIQQVKDMEQASPGCR